MSATLRSFARTAMRSIAVAACVPIVFLYILPSPSGISSSKWLKQHNELGEGTRRMAQLLLFQSYFNPNVDKLEGDKGTNTPETDLTGKLILLTGGNQGIGFHTAKGLVERGANVVIMSRNEAKSKEAITTISNVAASSNSKGTIEYLNADLSDLDSVNAAVDELIRRFPKREFDQIIENAGLWPTTPTSTLSKQNFEMAFATNVLGHHLLLRKLMHQNKLKEGAKVLVVTGDIYSTVDDVSPDFTYDTTNKATDNGGGQAAYSRSKLGVNWLFKQLVTEQPKYNYYLIHPGVIATELTGKVQNPFLNELKNRLFMTEKEGAQTTLTVATAAPSSLVNGGYYVNTLGLSTFPKNDHALDENRGKKLYAFSEKVIAPYLTK